MGQNGATQRSTLELGMFPAGPSNACGHGGLVDVIASFVRMSGRTPWPPPENTGVAADRRTRVRLEGGHPVKEGHLSHVMVDQCPTALQMLNHKGIWRHLTRPFCGSNTQEVASM